MIRGCVLELHQLVGEPEVTALAVAVAAIEVSSYRAAELSLPETCGEIEFLSGEGAEHRSCLTVITILTLTSGYDIDRTSHSVGSI